MRKWTLLLLGLTHMACSGNRQVDTSPAFDTGSAVATSKLRLIFASPDLSEVTCNAEAACADIYIGESATPANEAEGGIPFGGSFLVESNSENVMIHITAHGADNTAENRILSFDHGIPAGSLKTAVVFGTRADESGAGSDPSPVVHTVTRVNLVGGDDSVNLYVFNAAPGLEWVSATIVEGTEGAAYGYLYGMSQETANDARFTVITADRHYSGHIDLIAGEGYLIVLVGVLPTTGGEFLALQYDAQSSTAIPLLLTPVE